MPTDVFRNYSSNSSSVLWSWCTATWKVMCKKQPLFSRGRCTWTDGPRGPKFKWAQGSWAVQDLCVSPPPNLFLLLFLGCSRSLGRFPRGATRLWERVGEKGFCQNNLGKEAPRLILKHPDIASDFTAGSPETCPIFPCKRTSEMVCTGCDNPLKYGSGRG